MFRKSEKGNVAIVCSECIDELKEEFRKAEHQIRPGAYVKHRFLIPGVGTESMWVKITKVIDKENFEGILSNIPVLAFNLRHGDLVQINIDECLQFLPAQHE